MSRIVSSSRHRDAYYMGLSLDEAYTFDCLTDESNHIGIVEVTPQLDCVVAKVTLDRWLEIVAKLQKDGKVVFSQGYLALVNHYKHYSYGNPKHANPALIALDKLPDKIQKDKAFAPIIDNLKTKINNDLDARKGKPKIIANAMPMDCQSIDNGLPFDCHSIANGLSTPNINSNVNENVNLNQNVNSNSNDNPPNPKLGKSESNKIVTVYKDVLMRNKEVDAFVEKYGESMYEEIPKKVHEWYEWKGLQIDDGYKACCKFADRRLKEVSDGK